MFGLYDKNNKKNSRWPSERAVALRSIVESKSIEIYNNPNTLTNDLIALKISPVKAKQVELALTVYTVKYFIMSTNEHPSPVEINNVVILIKGCGIIDSDARDLTEDLLYSVKVKTYFDEFKSIKEIQKEKVGNCYIPSQLYKSRLNEIAEIVESNKLSLLTQEMKEELYLLSECNVGEACYILAVMYDTGFGVYKDLHLYSQYYAKAIAANYSPAYALYGDIAYNKNDFDKAYKYYTIPGAIAYSSSRKKRMNTLLKAKQFSNLICLLLGALYVLLSISIIILNNLLFDGEKQLLTGIYLILSTLIMSGGFILHYYKPLKDMRHWNLIFMSVFSLFIIIALI